VVTACTLEGKPRNWPPLPPIGKPIANTQIYLLDDAMRQVEEGQLYVGGASLARGYINRTEMTDARFVPNPFGPGRLYKTGDLARRDAQGNFLYLGRTDDQVKIRGVRVELGEIESVLSGHPGVREAAVTVRDGRLAAYFKGDAGVEDLRRWVRERLPEAFWPASFTLLERMPLTPSGKIDRRSLPEPAFRREEIRYESDAERKVAGSWRDVIGAIPGRDENFFEVGGDSLRVNALHRKLVESFGVEFPVTALFEHPTVKTQSRFLTQKGGEQAGIAAAGARGQKQRAALARKRLSKIGA
jgi:hypothetical protein